MPAVNSELKVSLMLTLPLADFSATDLQLSSASLEPGASLLGALKTQGVPFFQQVLLALFTSTSAHTHRTPSRGLEWTESPWDGGKQDLALPLCVSGKWLINDNYEDSLQSFSETRDQILP